MSSKVIPLIPSNANPSLCGSCGGKCCKSFPGLLLPTDIDPEQNPAVMKKRIRALLTTNNYSLDSWEGNPMVDEPVRGVQGYCAVKHFPPRNKA
jgi:hypothetical protein